MANNKTTVTRKLFINQLEDIPTIEFTNLNSGDKKFGIFTVMGTAEDDDRIKDIEVKIDSGSWIKAQGGENWSYKLDTSTCRMAVILYYRATDIYGKSSEYNPGSVAGYPKIKSITFEVDPDVPVIEFETAGNVMVNINYSFKGTVKKSSGGS